MRLRTPAVLTAAAMTLAGTLVVPATATAAATAPAAVVRLDNNGKVGRFEVALISGTVQCRAGAIVQELVVTVTQGTRTGTTATTNGIVCNGATHAIEVSVGASDFGPFAPGFASVDARLTVLKPGSMDPLPQGHANKQVWLRPPVRMVAASHARLAADGSLRLRVTARCETPWYADGISLSVSQDPPGFIGGEAFLPDVPVCDGQDHVFTVRFAPTQDPFRVGRAHVLAFLTVLDPASGDPVDQAQVNRTVRVLRPLAAVAAPR